MGSTTASRVSPLLFSMTAISLEVILSKSPIDHPFFVLPENLAAPRMVEFIGLSILSPPTEVIPP
jgi:hypothetical protein